MRYLVFSVLALSSLCSEKNNREFKLFETYLNSNYPSHIPKDTSVYFIVPTFNCLSCVEATKLLIKKFGSSPNVYLIRTESNQIEFDSIRTLLDENLKIDRLNLGFNSTVILVKTKEKLLFLRAINMGNHLDIGNSLQEFTN